jgi:chemotaxis protein methyltransferase CheR
MTGAQTFDAVRTDASGRMHGAAFGATALHETGFFRDREVFDALRETVLPRIIAVNEASRRLRVWCAACSTGQEAYSVALLLSESFAEKLAGWDVKIVATDIAADAVKYARGGLYRRAEVNRGLPARMLVKYFVRDGEDWEIAPQLRAMCEFREADMCVPHADTERFDLVLMRNVLLFLPEQEREAAFAMAHRRVAQWGVLLLGQAEQAEDSTRLFEAEYVHGRCFYRKAAKIEAERLAG